MALFSKRDRIALAVIAALIIGGWSTRFLTQHGRNEITIIRGAVEVPEGMFAVDPTAPVDINSADAKILESLPGIGPTKAVAIIKWREQHGPFSKPEDIMKVKGIGPKTFDAMKSRLTVGTANQ